MWWFNKRNWLLQHGSYPKNGSYCAVTTPVQQTKSFRVLHLPCLLVSIETTVVGPVERFPWEENLPETQTEQWMASCLTECWFTGHTASQRCLCSAEIRFFSQSRAENSSSEQWDLVLMCDFVELMDKDSDRWESKSSFSAWNFLSVWVLIYREEYDT